MKCTQFLKHTSLTIVQLIKSPVSPLSRSLQEVPVNE